MRTLTNERLAEIVEWAARVDDEDFTLPSRPTGIPLQGTIMTTTPARSRLRVLASATRELYGFRNPTAAIARGAPFAGLAAFGLIRNGITASDASPIDGAPAPAWVFQ